MKSNLRAPYPATRLRRLRALESTRRLTREHRLSVDDLIFPMFVLEDDDARQAVPSMPGIERLGIRPLIEEAGRVQQLGIPAIALFPAIGQDRKSPLAEEAWNPDGLIQR